jgi:hypothetical protein
MAKYSQHRRTTGCQKIQINILFIVIKCIMHSLYHHNSTTVNNDDNDDNDDDDDILLLF